MFISKLKSTLLLIPIIIGLSSIAENNANVTISKQLSSDICVYGASGPGIAAATAAAREGLSVIIIEPASKIGGLLGSGFRMQQDVPYADHLGGLTGEFYQSDINYPKLRHKQGAGIHNIASLNKMISQYNDLIQVILNHRLAEVEVFDKIIKEAIFEYAPPGKDGVPVPYRLTDKLISVKSKIFIDASYEGDLMAFSNVPYRVGKESLNEYNESLAGTVVGTRFPGVDPYKEKGNPQSGLLDCITPDPLGEIGAGSRFFMGYSFKLAWETDPTEEYPGILVTQPEKKNEDLYELFQRYVDAGYKITWPYENYNRSELMTGALPGGHLDYPDGDWPARSKVWREMIDHNRATTDFTDKEVRLLSGINEDTNGWPFLYIRGGRRMVGEYIMTQHDLQLQTEPPTPIGLGYYQVDVYPNRLVVLDDGTLAHEGNLWVNVSPGPYQIPYGALIPKKEDCENLLVPLCMSASHIAYSSIRMEATYMVMGESAGIAASQAIKENCAVQDINRSKLMKSMIDYGQILEWDGKGYRKWRYNIFSNPSDDKVHRGRWETHPEEYQKKSIKILWK
jgi:hypothetical protein